MEALWAGHSAFYIVPAHRMDHEREEVGGRRGDGKISGVHIILGPLNHVKGPAIYSSAVGSHQKVFSMKTIQLELPFRKRELLF